MLRGALRIAALESYRYVRIINRQVILTALVAGLLLGFLGPKIIERGVHTDAGLFTAEVDEASPLLPVVRSDHRFAFSVGVEGRFLRGEMDLLIVGENVTYDPDSPKSHAAAREFELAALRWLDGRMESEADNEAAFPVRVNLLYQPRALTPGQSDEPTTPTAPEEPPGPAPEATEPRLLNDTAQASTAQLDLVPSQVDPPFPIGPLILTFAFVIPLNFVAQLYSGALLADRIRHRGLMLLSTPHSGATILLGKSLPYVGVTVVAALIATIGIGSNPLGFLAALPILAFGLAMALLTGLLARSPRELTFLITTTSVLLSTFLFLPAIFIEIHPVAYLSPISVIVDTVRDEPVSVGSFFYATVPLALVALVLVALSVALFKEEHLFAPKTVLSKLVDAVHALTRSRRSLVAAGALAVPFAVGLEIFVLIFAVTLELRAAFIAFLVGGAFVEEALKALPIYGHLSRPGRLRLAPWMLGGLVGLGFFLGEKGALVFSLVGFGLLPLGTEALATFGVADSAILLAAPLILHSGASSITALGARRGRLGAVAGWFAASVVHFGYNLLIVGVLVGVVP